MIEVTAGIIRNDRGEVLIARKKSGKHLAGYWEFPGGKIEPGEGPEECLQREIKEELNIEIKVLNHIADSRYEYDNGVVLLKGYLAEYLNGEMHLKDHDKVEWVYPRKLVEYRMAPADLPFIQHLLKQLI